MQVTSPATAFRSITMSYKQLNLAHVLKSGQSFRWKHIPLSPPSPAPAEWSLCLSDRVVFLRQTPTELLYRSTKPQEDETTTKNWLHDYFQLDVHLERLYSQWGERDPVFKKRFVEDGALDGVRVLRQDPWECLFSFICSTNNNIPRITGMVSCAGEHFSPRSSSSKSKAKPPKPQPLYIDPETKIEYYPFPPPSAFTHPSTEQKLRDLGFGYRAGFIYDTALMLCEEHPGEGEAERFLISLRKKPIEEAREELLKFKGVGPKVADCVLLMCLDFKQTIPIDTHVISLARRLYHFNPSPYTASKEKKMPMTPILYGAVGKHLASIWGEEWAGWCQAVLFASDLAFLNPVAVKVEVKEEVLVKIESVLEENDQMKTPVKRRTMLQKKFITSTLQMSSNASTVTTPSTVAGELLTPKDELMIDIKLEVDETPTVGGKKRKTMNSINAGEQEEVEVLKRGRRS